MAETPRFAYVANPFDYTISKYYLDESGRMFPNGMVYTRDKFPSAIIVHPNGKFLFAASRTVDSAPIYKIDPETGWLQETKSSHFDTRLRSPFSYSFHPSGKYLYLAGRGGGVAGFEVNEETGDVKYVPGSPFKAGERTRCLTVHPSGKFVYATNAYTNNISAYRINQKTGSLKQLANSPFNAGEEGPFDDTFAKLPDIMVNKGGLPYFVAAHPSGDFLYVTNWAAASISMFRVNQETGDLTQIDRPKETGLTPYAVAVHPSGDFVMVSTWGGNDVYVYSVDKQTGRLEFTDGSPYQTYGLKPVDITFNKTGTLAYVANVTSNNVSIFDVDAKTGKMTLIDIGTTRAGSVDVEVVPYTNPVELVAKHAFLVDKESNSLYSYTVNHKTGDLVKASETKANGDPVAVAKDPLNRFVYVANESDNSVSAFTVDNATGQLGQVEGSPFTVGKKPTSIVVDANGWYLYTLNEQSQDMSAFLIHLRTGQLAEAQGSPLSLSKNAQTLTADPTSRFLYVNNQGSNSISTYRYRTSITPSIFEINSHGSPFTFSSMPSSISIDPTGRFALILEGEKNQVSMRLVHVATGGLEQIKKNIEPFSLKGKGGIQALFHPSGKYAYVLNQQSQSISQLAVERIWGNLSRVDEPIKVEGKPTFFSAEPSGQFIYVGIDNSKNLIRYRVDSMTGKLVPAGSVKLPFVPEAMAISRDFRQLQ